MSNETHPYTQPSALPYELPDFSAATPQALRAAILEGITQQRSQWEQIAQNPAPATVENTLDALEASGEILRRALPVFWTMTSSIGGETWDALESELTGPISEHFESFHLNPQIYARLQQVDAANATAEARYRLSETLRDFELAGVGLPEQQREKMQALSTEQSRLETEFSQRVVAAMKQSAIEVEGLERGTLENATAQAFAATIDDPARRAAIYQASISRCDGHHAPTDTRELITKIARIRAKKAQLLGQPNHAQVVASREMAGQEARIRQLLQTVGQAALKKAQEEGKTLHELATKTHDFESLKNEQLDSENPTEKVSLREAGFSAADWLYWETKARRSALGVDDTLLAPYLELHSVVENGVFYAANQLFGLEFRPVQVAGWVADMPAWEVLDHDGQTLGLFLADYYTRPGKSGGAWMHDLVNQSGLLGHKPVICNNLNIEPPAAGQPTLLTWDQVVTAFHEFGHALHGLLSNCFYPSGAGTEVPRDYVEFPSQLNEMWAYHPQVIANFARHVETGQALDQALVERLADSAKFGQGYATLEYVQAAELDQAWHRLSPEQVPSAEGAADFEAESLRAAGLEFDLVAPRYRSCYFSHTFGGGYDAGYYSYLWAEVLVAQTEAWFKSQPNGGLTRESGQRLRDEILSRGSSRDPLESFVALVGAEPDPQALLQRRALA